LLLVAYPVGIEAPKEIKGIKETEAPLAHEGQRGVPQGIPGPKVRLVPREILDCKDLLAPREIKEIPGLKG